ncbi:MAG TPA: hypothetical protein VK661_11055 [Planctomycetota bacterium]|nr:hypothetical protein [Planctomycetota bacterium]
MTEGSRPAPARRRALLIVLPAAAAFVALVALAASRSRSNPGDSSRASARAGSWDWEVTSEGDFEERAVDSRGSRWRIHAATRGTRPDTVKFLGVRRLGEIRLGEGTRISADLDWNSQSNGSGLSAGIVLAPAATSGNPLATPASLRVEFIGVPPGKKARMVVAVRESGNERYLYTEGWPDTNREGRPIGVQRLTLVFEKGGSFKVLENGGEVYASGPNALSFDRAHLYLQMSTRSNYPPREVFFDNVSVAGGR